MGIDPAILALVCALVCGGAFLQGTTGVGLGLFASPVVLLIAPEYVPGPMLVPMFFTAVLAVWREFSAVDWVGTAAALIGRLPAAVLAALTLTALTQDSYARLFAILILAAVAISLLGLKVRRTTTSMGIAGFASGYMGTLTSIGGPPMVIVMQHGSGAEVRATLSAYFTVGAIVSIASLAGFGSFTGTDLVRGLVLVPPMLLGFFASRWGIRLVDRGLLRRVLLSMVVLSALVLLLRGA